MSFQLFYFFTVVCVLNQANAHFGTADAGGKVTGSFLGDLFRAGGNVKYQLADVSDNAVNRVRGLFHKKTPSNPSFGIQTGYTIQAAPYGHTQPPVDSYRNGVGAGVGVGTGVGAGAGAGVGAGAGAGGRFGRNIGIVPARCYDSHRPFASSGNVEGHVNVGASLPSISGTLLDEDHLEYVSSTGVRRRLSYEEIVQLVMAVVDSSKSPTGSGGFTGRYIVPTGGSMGISIGGYPGVATGYPGVATGYPGVATGYPGVATGYPGVPSGYPGVPSGYPGVPTGGYPGVPTAGFLGVPSGSLVGGYGGVPLGPSVGYTGVPSGPPASGYAGVPTGRAPVPGSTAVDPTGGGQAGSSTNGVPAGGPTREVSAGGSTGGISAGGSTGGIPAGGSTGGIPAGGSTGGIPAGGPNGGT